MKDEEHMKKYSITTHIGNYNGMRNQIDGKGRLQLTMGSFLDCVPTLPEMDVRFVDNYSEDGSWEYIQSLPFGVKESIPKLEVKPKWLSITINNMANMKRSVLSSDSKYFWNVENDTYFFNKKGDFVDKAIEIMESNPDISLVHMRRFTEIDEHDLPGVPINLNRYSEVRLAPSGFEFYIMEKRPEYALWIPTGLQFRKEQIDGEAGYGKCPKGVIQIGAIREREGGFERLLTEHWNSYTSNGWIARREDLQFLIEKYDPIGERQTSLVFKKHFKAAKLGDDVFIEFGWKARTIASENERKKVLQQAEKGKNSIRKYGSYKFPYEGVDLDIPEKQLDVYLRK